MLNLERLRALQAVSAYGSLNAAAEILHVTTSAVSQQLAKLEREIGEPLMERDGRGVRLTRAAHVLVTHTLRAMSALEEAESEIDAQRTGVAGPITVTAFATAARGLAPRAIAELRQRHPALRVVFREQSDDDVFPLLERRDVDVAIEAEWFNRPLALPDGLSKAFLLDDVADIALPAGHRLAHRPSVRLADLSDESWICWHEGTMCHDWLLHTLRTLGHSPRIVHTAAEHATQLALVAAGLGCAVMPRLGLGTVPAGVTLVPADPSLHRRVYAVWRAHATKRRAITEAIEAFHVAARALTSPAPAAARGSADHIAGAVRHATAGAGARPLARSTARPLAKAASRGSARAARPRG
jgi:DNA-binding transcriptional LysR family regulator